MKTHKTNTPLRQESLINPAREIEYENNSTLINKKGKEEKQIVGAKGFSTAFFLKDTFAMQGRVAKRDRGPQMRSRRVGSRCRTKSRVVFLTPPWGRKRAHTHAQAHTYMCTHTLSLSHTHTLLLPNERETPAFPGQLTYRRTGCRTETHQLSQPENPSS